MTSSLTDRVCLVTGATSGMGQATAAALAERGATVILVARNPQKGIVVRDALRAQTGNTHIEVLNADLAALAQVRQLARAVRDRYDQLHVLINNAGGIFFKRVITPDGLETSWAVNYLAPFLLTQELLPLLQASAPARIINISSSVERVGRLHYGDLQRARGYFGFTAYAQAKLAMLQWSYELARRLAGTGVTVNAVTPGPVATNFGKENRVISRLFSMARDAAAGAETAIMLATAPEYATINGQAFYNKQALKSSRRSYDRAAQERLWAISLEQAGGAAPIISARG